MKKIMWFLVAVAVGICGAANLLAAGEQEASPIADYVIGLGDTLTISVWKDESLTRQVVVLPDGKIAFPLVGQLPAAGRTVAELTRDMEQKLERFVPGVTLSVVVQQVNSLMVYVIGRVNTPGRFVLNSDINVLQALAMAGGLNPFAKRGDIRIFREAGGGTKVMYFDYDKVSVGEEVKQNIKLRRGDVIVVP
ncbi:MAG: polysaccharide biosynthesis/export family protein [Deltaproteobacteria bacterium]|nr:polysaccharide biosynthesis/export family protein [Deltaproteobacteria bacterium]